MRRLFGYELKKILTSPIIIGLIIVSLSLNGLIIAFYQLPLATETPQKPENVFRDLNAQTFAEYYIHRYQMTDQAAELVRAKYARLQSVIDDKAVAGDALSVYFGRSSHVLHHLLFGVLMKLIWAECLFISLAMTLLLMNYEVMARTEMTVYSSLVGRKIVLMKLVTCLVCLLIVASILLATTLVISFWRFDFGRAWFDNVSSSFNHAPSNFGKPFITWDSYSLGAYLGTVIGLGICLGAVIVLITYISSILTRNGFFALSLTCLMLGLPLLLKPLFQPGDVSRAILAHSPLGLWQHTAEWLTDGPVEFLWPHFEKLGLAVNLGLSALGALGTTWLFGRKDIL